MDTILKESAGVLQVLAVGSPEVAIARRYA
jgi:hypothetical protein